MDNPKAPKPATPLPWIGWTARKHHQVWGDNRNRLIAEVRQLSGPNGFESSQDAAYIAHAANAYPKLVEALKGALAALEFNGLLSDQYDAHSKRRALLAELGE